MIIGVIIGIIMVILIVVKLTREDRDKSKREKQGLPPKKYHDITDYDITTIDTIIHK